MTLMPVHSSNDCFQAQDLSPKRAYLRTVPFCARRLGTAEWPGRAPVPMADWPARTGEGGTAHSTFTFQVYWMKTSYPKRTNLPGERARRNKRRIWHKGGMQDTYTIKRCTHTKPRFKLIIKLTGASVLAINSNLN